MGKSLAYHPLFESDVREAAAWCDSQRAGLGDRFVESVRSCVNSIISDPERLTQVEEGVRYGQLRVFPFVVLFEVTERNVFILSVLHTARSPEKWFERRVPDGK